MMIDDLIEWCRKQDRYQDILVLLTNAERFDFGDLILEKHDEEYPLYTGDDGQQWKAPKLSEDELEFWFEGLIPVPAPICWYEFAINSCISGFIVIDDEEGHIAVQRIEFEKTPNNPASVLIDTVWAWLNRDRTVGITITDDRSRELLTKKLKNDPGWASTMYGTGPYIMIYLTLMINSQTTEVRKVVPNADTNRLRRLRGKALLKPHTVVTIVPIRFIDEEKTNNNHPGSGSKKRLHWRRSHLRTYHRGEPEEFKKVIPRFLVGRRELGEITHEYRIKAQKD